MNALEILNRIGTVGDQSDENLLARFLDVHDAGSKAALTALIERHGPMVFRVCRQVLGNSQDADDAFQATFLVFARKARSIRNADSAASWLHGVALRVARRSKLDALRRRSRESRVAVTNLEIEKTELESWPELHEEIGRLPERYREAVVLCHLEGLSTEAAAVRIGCPRGTVLSRLSRARDRLRDRLTRRGMALSSTWFAEVGSMNLPHPLVEVTARSCWVFVGREAATSAVSATVITLTKEMFFAMTISKIKALSGVVVFLGFTTVGAGVLVHAGGGSPLQKPQAPPTPAVEPETRKDGKINVVINIQPDPNKKLAQAQLKLVEEAIRYMDDLSNNARMDVDDPRSALWIRRLLEAARSAGVDKVKLVSLLESNLTRAKKRVEVAKARNQAARATLLAVMDAEYQALEAEMWLNEEKAR